MKDDGSPVRTRGRDSKRGWGNTFLNSTGLGYYSYTMEDQGGRSRFIESHCKH